MADKKLILSIGDYRGDIIDEVSPEILKYTPQLFINGGSKPEPFASSILITLSNTNFLITAGHVLHKIAPTNLGIFFDNIFYILNGEVKYTDISVSENNNKIDLAVWKLNDEVVQSISKKYSFFNLDGYNFDHEIKKEPRYIVIGFPATRTKLKPNKKKYIVSPFIFHTTLATTDKYEKLKLHKNTHVLLDYIKRKIKTYGKKGINEGPKPNGVSGCGVWCLPTLLVEKGNKIPFFPSGIVIEYHQNLSTFVATRINIVTEIIRQKFELDIPATKIANVNIE